ncbi:Aryl-alcohol dehydrogenase [NADP(+)] [Grifola frondosa]|uniref:Aryl-alcohol dehydrogenase [NADP(+)] n=1 Tax=Grifola frondosa TaxID=5627 RepID=A0A1C7MKV5_GRIFR|nr:Aryl-alcohol dehydrogenase [NADP(+)] [Grifola frondosa]
MSTFWTEAPAPATKLGRYRQLSPLAGVHVSPICLGAMSIGDKWADLGMGSMNKESSFKLLDAYYEAGGNFIDTANNYQDETSEMFIGEWMEARGIRDQLVVATKYTSFYKRGSIDPGQKIHYIGNNMKALHLSVEDSLKKLRTSYIDILYLHWWDYTTSVEEVMNGLHHLVAAGKVLYLGVSDTPRGSSQKRTTTRRDFERDIIPMAKSEGLALAPWNVLAAGRIRTDEEEQRRRETGEKGRTIFGDWWERSEDERKVCKALEKVAAEVGAKSIQAVAIAYVMQKTPYVFPIIGGRKVEHLQSNIHALDIALSPEQVKYLENALPFNPGFPNEMIGDGSGYSTFHLSAGIFDKWPAQQAIRPAQ